MVADSKFGELPTSPLRSDDKFIVNRQNVSHKIETSDLIYYLAQIDLPIVKDCIDVNDCPDGFVCVDGKCERLPCGDNEFCPLGYTCINDYCYKLCSGNTCKEGYICVDYLGDGNSICIPYPFPCDSENGCPPGFECYEGYCLQTCSIDPNGCPPGSDCITVDIITDNGIEQKDYCIPYPFPCGSIGEFPSNDGCPPGYYCYGGSCYPLCVVDGDCEGGFECTDIGDGINICYPASPSEGFINDGPLVVRTIPVDPNKDYTENIMFTANQYGRSILTLQGFEQNPGQNPGGGSGGEIIINIDPEWWDPEINILLPDQPGSSPVRNGHLQFQNTGGDQPSQNPGGLCSVFAANQDGHSQISLSDGFELFDHTASSGTPNSNNEVTGKLRIGADRTHLNFWKWDYTEDGSTRNTGDNDGKTSFKMSQNVDIVPNGTDCNLGRLTEQWASVHTKNVSLQNNGSILLGGDVGKPNQILTSNGNGQAIWDFIHFESQEQRVFISKVGQHASNQPLDGSDPGGNNPGSLIWSKTEKISGIQEAILSFHATVDFSKHNLPDSKVVQVRVCLYDVTSSTYVFADWASTGSRGPQTITVPSTGCTVDGKGGSTNPVDIIIPAAKSHACVAAFTFTDKLDPTHEYEVHGGGYVEGGNPDGITLYDGSVRGFFIR